MSIPQVLNLLIEPMNDIGAVDPSILATLVNAPWTASATGIGAGSTQSRRPSSATACEIYRDVIADAIGRGRTAGTIWQDLADDHG